MNEIQQAAYVIAQAACAQIEAIGMQSANQALIARGEMPKYYEDDFDRLIQKYGIHHNGVIETFRR